MKVRGLNNETYGDAAHTVSNEGLGVKLTA